MRLSASMTGPLSVARVIGCSALLAITAAGGERLEAGTQPQPPVVSLADAPEGADAGGVQWVQIAAPGVGTMLAAVARPESGSAAPAILLLHGTHGFAPEYVSLAKDLARGGVLAVAACWFSGGSGPGARFVGKPIPCPDAPRMPMAASPDALRIVDALLQAVRSLAGVRPDRVAILGHSRGAGATLNYIQNASTVGAAILNSGGYPEQIADVAARVTVPVLILHGALDGPASGGSEFTAVGRARGLEAALRHTGKPVDAKYYEAGDHNSMFTNPAQRQDTVRRMLAFLRARLMTR